MPIFNWKGFSAKKNRLMEGTIRAKDGLDARERVLKNRLGGSGEVTVWPKKKNK